MRISKKSEYALRALCALARSPGTSWSIHDLAVSENIPIKFLEQILLVLRNGGMLASKRGAGGGYNMLKEPHAITLADVVTLLDGPVAPVACAAERPQEPCTCPEPATCPLRKTMVELRLQLHGWLASITLEEMARGPESPAFDI
jgi:Rrf2 family protein